LEIRSDIDSVQQYWKGLQVKEFVFGISTKLLRIHSFGQLDDSNKGIVLLEEVNSCIEARW